MNNKPFAIVFTVITVFLFTFIWTFANYAQGPTNARDRERKERIEQLHWRALEDSIRQRNALADHLHRLGDMVSADAHKRHDQLLQETLASLGRIANDVASRAEAARLEAQEQIEKGNTITFGAENEAVAGKEDSQNPHVSTEDSPVNKEKTPENVSQGKNEEDVTPIQRKTESSKSDSADFVAAQPSDFQTVVITPGKKASRNDMKVADDPNGKRSSSQQTSSNTQKSDNTSSEQAGANLPSDASNEESISEAERYRNRYKDPFSLTIDDPTHRELLLNMKFPTPLDYYDQLHRPERYEKKKENASWFENKFDNDNKDLVERKNRKWKECGISTLGTVWGGAKLAITKNPLDAPTFALSFLSTWDTCREAVRLSNVYDQSFRAAYSSYRLEQIANGHSEFNYTPRDEERFQSLLKASESNFNSN